jgi:glycosyltransferase involved in cell wall biosynthesis
MHTPPLSVILPAYNAERYIGQAIESVLGQDYRNFELIIADDGSKDQTLDRIRSFSDSRIKIIENETNIGLIATLNKCIAAAKGEFIARMDADDICMPGRFTKQIDYLKQHPEIGIVSSFMSVVGRESHVYAHRFTSPDLVKAGLLFTNPLVHPAVVFRKSAIEGKELYSTKFLHAEDYGLWISLIKDVSFYVIPEALLAHRTHPEQVSVQHYLKQKESVCVAHELLFNHLGISATPEEREIHFSLYLEEYPKEKDFVNRVENWLQKLVKHNEQVQLINHAAFCSVVGEWWFRVNQVQTSLHLSNYKTYSNSSLKNIYKPSLGSKAKMIVRSFGVGAK